MIGILIDERTGDLDLSTGRLALGEVTAQTTAIVAEMMPGELAEYPYVGLGLRLDLGGRPDPTLPTRAVKMLRDCGLPTRRVEVAEGLISVIY